jgi:hypothetical protein
MVSGNPTPLVVVGRYSTRALKLTTARFDNFDIWTTTLTAGYL